MIRMMSTIMIIRMILRTIGQRNLEMEIMTMDDSHEKILGMGIDELELSVRSYNCLKRAGINTVEELCKMSSEDMMHVRNLGRKALEEILQKLKDMGLGLGYDGQEQETYTEFNHPGRNRCDQLREIRRRIAKANNIEFEPIECHHTEPCLGTCLMCDYEVSYLDRKLQEKQGRGEKIELKGLMSGKDE